MSSWPSSLPDPCVSGYALKRDAGMVRTEMESGPARTRRRYRQTPTVVPVQWVLTLDELATFQAWVEHEIDQGAAWFDAQLLTGIGLVTVRTRFKAAEEATPQGNGANWLVKAELEVEKMPVLTQAQLAPRL